MKQPDPHRRSQGYTLVELIVVIAVSGLLSVALVGVVGAWIQQYAVAGTRNTILADIQTSSHKISDDVRKSTKLLNENSTTDPDAPTTAGRWTSSSNTLVLAQTPRNSSGAGLYDDAVNFNGIPDSVVYYLNGQTLYRRVIPANYTGNVALPLVTCATSATGGCSTDTKILGNVSSLTYTFLDSSGNTTVDPSATTAISVTIQSQKTVAGQTVKAQDTSVMAFRRGSTASDGSTNAALAAGYGGINAINGSKIAGANNQSVYTQGGINLAFAQNLNASSDPFLNVYAANMGCGTGANYGTSCAPTEPINVANGSIYANNICATNQVTSSSTFGVLQTITKPCTAPFLRLPTFNKAAFVAKMTNTPQGSQTCNAAPGTCSITLPANTTFNGSIGGGNASLNLTITGSIYVTGSFGNIASGGVNQPVTITVADSVTTPPIIVANGPIKMAWTTIKKNASGIAPVFVSFYSSDSTCSQSTNCSATPQLIYNTLNSGTQALYSDCGGCTQEASFYAYYGILDIGNQTTVRGNLAGQKIILDNGLSNIYLNSNPWPTS